MTNGTNKKQTQNILREISLHFLCTQVLSRDRSTLWTLLSWYVDMLSSPGTFSSLAQGGGSGDPRAVWGKAGLWWWKGGGKSYHLFQVPKYLELSAWLLGDGVPLQKWFWGELSSPAFTQLRLIWGIWFQNHPDQESCNHAIPAPVATDNLLYIFMHNAHIFLLQCGTHWWKMGLFWILPCVEISPKLS